MSVTWEAPGGWENLGWEPLAPGVGRLRLPVWDCTVGLVAGPEGALLVDAGSSVAEGTRIRQEAEELLNAGAPSAGAAGGTGTAGAAGGTGAERRVTHVALTHPHFDHVLGACVFAGAETFAAVGSGALLTSGEGRDALRADAVAEGLAADVAESAVELLTAPRHEVHDDHVVDLGGGVRPVLANVGPGHTAHDLAVLVPGPRPVVFCGDLVEESGEPQAGPDAVASRWTAALTRLLELGGEDALYVPGHGAVVDAAFVRRQREELSRRFGTAW
ncbi:MBL fold metallo-hydrolase [Streptomyces abyssomicinicus]|uniref:MBL fold metallo-hydrolase n=1 Tax=Streptomyces abyssomicinicus TaxID=574929 RepID=UPI0012504315|nr:MBL fold metallo-hydrolase [Streptomyces abyssomicinicus]